MIVWYTGSGCCLTDGLVNCSAFWFEDIGLAARLGMEEKDYALYYDSCWEMRQL